MGHTCNPNKSEWSTCVKPRATSGGTESEFLPLGVRLEHAVWCSVQPGRPGRGSGSCSTGRWRCSGLALGCGTKGWICESVNHQLQTIAIHTFGVKVSVVSCSCCYTQFAVCFVTRSACLYTPKIMIKKWDMSGSNLGRHYITAL